MNHDIIGLIAVTGLFLIPSLALAGHLLVRPLLEAYLKAKGLDRPPEPVDQGRLTRLEEQMSLMQERMDRLTEAVDFDRQLRAGPATATPRLPQGEPTALPAQARTIGGEVPAGPT